MFGAASICRAFIKVFEDSKETFFKKFLWCGGAKPRIRLFSQQVSYSDLLAVDEGSGRHTAFAFGEDVGNVEDAVSGSNGNHALVGG
jgi:hypothetical protein